MAIRQDVKSTGGKKPAGRFHHGDLAAASLGLACQIVEDQGHEALSLRQLARQLGVSEPALYRHYADKVALLEAVGFVGLERFAAALKEAIGDEVDPFGVAERLGRAYVRQALAQSGWFRLYFSRVLTSRMGDPTVLAAALEKAPSLVVFDQLRAALGQICPEKVDDLYRSLWALCHGLAVFVIEQVFQRVQTDPERIAAADAAIALHIDTLRHRWGDPTEAVQQPRHCGEP